MKKSENITLALHDLTKGNVWDLTEADIFTMWQSADKDDDIAENTDRYLSIIHTAFDIEDVKFDKPEFIKKYEARGMTVGLLDLDGKEKKYAIKKHPINRVTDLNYENIHHISAAKLLEVIDSNFGGGWDSLNQSTRDIILDGFDVSTTTTPKDRLHKPGGLYEIKINDGYEALEIEKGSWVEAIFAKPRPKKAKLHVTFGDPTSDANDDDMDDDTDVEVKDDYYSQDDDDELDDEELTQESYRTTIEENPDDLSLDAVAIAEDGEDY